MVNKSEYLEYILDLLEPSGGISSVRMFGGYAIKKYGLTIALIFEEEAYFKTDKSNIEDYKKLGSKPFSYEKQGKTIIVSNWRIPIEILEDQEKLMQWIEKSYQVAKRVKK
jgi:DNA transformation protein